MTSQLAVLYPAIAEAAFGLDAGAIGLIDVALSPGSDNLVVDTVGITYSNGQALGDPDSPSKVACRLVGDCPIPMRPISEIRAKVAVDSLEALPPAFDRVPPDALPVITTTWALSRLARGARQHFLDLLGDAAVHRHVAWVSVEGVGVAPGIPTLGDRRASGHSIVGVARFDRMSLHVRAVGRCWSRGRVLEWLVDE